MKGALERAPQCECYVGWLDHCRTGRNLVSEYLECDESARTERGRDRDIGRIAPTCHEDAADAGLVIARIERIPLAAEIDFEPCAEVHRLDNGNADIAHIAGAVTRRNVHAPAES